MLSKVVILTLLVSSLYSEEFILCAVDDYRIAKNDIWVDGTNDVVSKKSIRKISNGVYQAWITTIGTETDRRKKIDSYGDKFSEYGFSKVLVKYDVNTEKSKELEIAHYTCNGKIIWRGAGLNEWHYILPDSEGEAQLSAVKKAVKIK